MSPKSRFHGASPIENRPLGKAHDSHDAAVLRARLGRVARREPTTVLGVLEYWLSPQSAGSKPRVDQQY
jgi:hypothetical protein